MRAIEILSLTPNTGYQRTTTPHLRDLHPRLPPPRLSLQLPPVRPPFAPSPLLLRTNPY